MQQNTQDMTKGEAWKVIITFAIPILFSNLFQQLYNSADSLIVGNFIGKNSLYLLCIHAIDQWWKILFTSNGQFKTILKRVVVDLIIFFVYMLIVIGIKKFYNKNKG